MSNIYYNPEDFGLEIIGELNDPRADYDFDDVVLFRQTETGRIGFATDSGCSCPAPFEFQTLDEITWVDSAEGWAALQEATIDRESYYSDRPFYNPADVSEFLRAAAPGRWRDES